ncbi:MAG: nucleotidyltransferase family protein [Candidatus Korarchaeota archaeon]
MVYSNSYYYSFIVDKLLYNYFIRIPREFVIRIAKNNKVLYQLGMLFPEIRKSNEWNEISKRRYAQVEELIKFNELANKLGFKYAVVKTFRFPGYVPDDIDILVHPDSRHSIWDFISLLVERYGYFIRSRGTTEMTIRKKLCGTYVDFDIHTNLAAGPYIYLDARLVFDNLITIKLKQENIPTVHQKLEFVICAAHSIMKEFELTLADILTFLYLYSPMNETEILRTAKQVGLTNAVSSFCRLSQIIVKNLLQGKTINLPYRIPLYFILHAYVENISYRAKFHGFKPIMDLLSFPRARGIKKLIKI